MTLAPDVLIIGTIKMLAQLGETQKIVELCDEWLSTFDLRPELDGISADWCECKVTPRVDGICVTCGKPRLPF